MSSEEGFFVSPDFIEENRNNLGQFMPKPRRKGPYSKHDRDSRRNEAYKLHFEFGYSARKIADLMKVNRNTVNGDIDYWYSKIYKNNSIFNPEDTIIVTLQRFESQRTRLRERLAQNPFSYQERIAIERLIYDIDSKILQTHHRLTESTRRLLDESTERINEWLKDNHKPGRYMKLFDKITVSDKGKEKINKILKEDKKHSKFF